MDGESARLLMGTLTARRDAIVQEWLARTLRSYPEHTGRFLVQERDPFRNPVGQTLRDALPALFDEIVGGMDSAALRRLLDPIVRIRAVQDFTAGQAVAFLFLLKPVVREALQSPPHPPLSPLGGEDRGEGAKQNDDLAALDERIDQMTLLAFDLFMRCREQVYEIKANEARRRVCLLERMQRGDPATDAPAPRPFPYRAQAPHGSGAG